MQKFNIIHRSELDTNRWDRLINDDPDALIYDLTFYRDAISENWMVISDENWKCAAAFSFKNRAGYKNIYQPFFSRQSGVYGSEKKKHTRELLTHIPKEYKHFHWCAQLMQADCIPESFTTEQWIFQILDISRPMQDIVSTYSENTRRMLRKAQNKKIRIDETNNVGQLISFFQHEKGSDIKDLKEKDYERLRVLMKNGIRLGYGKIYQAKNEEGVLLAIGFFWFFKDRITYLKGTSNPAGRSDGAMYALFDHVIQSSTHRFRYLDFGGSRVPSIAGFYKRFGAADSGYSSLSKGKKPLLIRLAKKLMSKVEK